MNKSHRTIVFVRHDTHAERAGRLIESLGRSGESPNGTIKVDVVTVTADGKLVPGLQLGAQTVSALTDDDLHAYADEQGYDMNLIVS